MKYIVSLAILACAGSFAYFTLAPSAPTEYVAPKSEVVAPVAPDAIGEAEKQLREASEKLDAQEKALIAEIEQASSSANAKIVEIESERDAVISAKEKEIERINSARASF